MWPIARTLRTQTRLRAVTYRVHVQLQQQPLSAIRRRVSDSDVVDFVDDSFPPEAPDLLTETDLFGGLSLVPPPLRQSASGACK